MSKYMDLTYEHLTQRLHAYEKKHFGRGATLERITETERTLGVSLPNSYRSFLRDFGWGGVDHIEIFGLGDDVPPHLDLLTVTKSERIEMRPRIPIFLTPVMNDGAGNHYCLDTRHFVDQECPVIFWDHELGESQHIEQVALNFVHWLEGMLDELDE